MPGYRHGACSGSGGVGRQIQLELSELSGRPFNRICGLANAEHRHTVGTNARARVERADGECLAEQNLCSAIAI
jgi:hypothetical protein